MSDGNFHSHTVKLIYSGQIYARLRTSDPAQLCVICKCFLLSTYSFIPLQMNLACVNQHKAVVGSECYHHKLLYEQNGWRGKGPSVASVQCCI
jgi:hypothetical protein